MRFSPINIGFIPVSLCKHKTASLYLEINDYTRGVTLDDLVKKYLSFYEDVISATLLNPELQAKMQDLTVETMKQFASQATPATSQPDDSSQ